MAYKIIVIRSVCGNFMWELRNMGERRGGSKVAECPQMITKKEMCMKVVKKLSKALNCPIKFVDLEKDWEE